MCALTTLAWLGVLIAWWNLFWKIKWLLLALFDMNPLVYVWWKYIEHLGSKKTYLFKVYTEKIYKPFSLLSFCSHSLKSQMQFRGKKKKKKKEEAFQNFPRTSASPLQSVVRTLCNALPSACPARGGGGGGGRLDWRRVLFCFVLGTECTFLWKRQGKFLPVCLLPFSPPPFLLKIGDKEF